ncbi:FAD-binding protein [Biomaibacter acetigenes]|nr:FAD-binding protein [Biomaibacter acetigenes]
MKILDCDILVVGGGGAALRAAIAAKEYNKDLRVLIATKGKLGKSGVTATACSDRMAFHATLDHTEPGGPGSWRYHADDIYRIGGKVSDYKLAEGPGQKRKRRL